MNDGVGIDIHHLNDSGQAGEKMGYLQSGNQICSGSFAFN